MKKISRLATILVLSVSFGMPLVAAAVGNIPLGGDCTGNSSGCVSGLYCVPGDLGSTCSSSSSGYVPPTNSGAGTGVPNLNVITPYSAGIINFINSILVPVLFAIAFIVFLWGVFKYFILGAADEKSRTDGKQFVLWGLIGFVVILSVWGIVTIVGQTLGLQLGGAAPFKPPTL
jgi:hypothetical protein